MRVRLPAVLAVSVACAAAGASLVACFDLFHSTADIVTACELDAQAPGCSGSTPTDFCAWTAAGETHAEHACAWLGACENPMGNNAYGACMFEARLAFDCNANPDHRVKGKAHALWDCLWQAQSCSDVDRCVFPRGPQPCGGSAPVFTACGTAGDDAGNNNFDVRIGCVDGGVARGENCALWGQTCVGGACTGGNDCRTSPDTSCVDNRVHLCPGDSGSGDLGVDCASNGAQHCGGFPDPTRPTWLACVPESDAGSCNPSLSVSCSYGVAISCPAGVYERIDCNQLLGLDAGGAGCQVGPLGPPFDWTSPCGVEPPQCSGDGCNGNTLTGCARGAPFTVDCNGVGLGACHMVTTADGQTHAACAEPRP